MAKIVCVGCSFSSGTHYTSPNWVESLAKLHPEHTFYNLAVAGSSVLHSIMMLEQAKRILLPDLTIFQITTEGMITYYKDEQLDQTHWTRYLNNKGDSSNYKKLLIPIDFVSCINPGTLMKTANSKHPLYKEQKMIAEMYYKHFSKKRVFDVEQRALVHYVKSISDCYFYHLQHETNDPGIISMHGILGEEQFYNFVVDDGCHFGQEGSDWQAEFLSSLFIKGRKLK